MPSLTLLAADPHLTPVRARPSLAFGVQTPGVRRRGRGRRLSPSARRRRHQQAGTVPAAPHRAGASEVGASVARRRWAPRLALRKRGVPSPSRRRSFLGWRSLAAAAVLAVIVAGLGVLRVWPPFAVVMSGSMTPTIKTGDMVVLMHLHGPARVGDVVEVPVPDDARTRYGYPPVVIHRVFRITGGQIRTKGDARPAGDPFTVPQTAVQAKVVADIPAGGRILSFFHSGPGLLWLLFGAALFFGLPLLDRLREARGREAEATADLRDQLAAVSAGLAHLQTEQERSRQAADETLAQIDRLTRLVAATLDREPTTAGGDVPASEGASGDTADPFGDDPATSGAVASVPAGSCAPAAEPTAASTSESSSASVLDPVDAEGSAVAVDPRQMVGSVTHLAPLTETAMGREAAPDQVSAATAAARPCSSALVMRVMAPAGLAPTSTGPLSALERWDAPPAASGFDGRGWAAPPVPTRSARFRPPGRLIAASLAQPSPVA